MTTTDKTGAEQAPGWAKPCPRGACAGAAGEVFTREPMARYGCAHCGHAGDFLAALVAPACPECGCTLLRLAGAPGQPEQGGHA